MQQLALFLAPMLMGRKSHRHPAQIIMTATASGVTDPCNCTGLDPDPAAARWKRSAQGFAVNGHDLPVEVLGKGLSRGNSDSFHQFTHRGKEA